MPKKILKNNKKVTEGDKPKAETYRVIGTLTKKQKEIIQSLIGTLGSNEQDVIGNILTIWLYNEGFLKNNGDNKNIKGE